MVASSRTFAMVSAAALVVAVELMALVDAGEALRLVGQQARGAATFPDSLAFEDEDRAARLSTNDPSQGDDTTMTAVFLTGYPEALCLDGTPGAYYLRAGKSKDKWMVYFEGGGMLLLDPLVWLSLRRILHALPVGQTTPLYLPLPISNTYHTYLPPYLPACLPTRSFYSTVLYCTSFYLPSYPPTYLPTVPTYLPTYHLPTYLSAVLVPTSLPTSLLACLPAYLPT